MARYDNGYLESQQEQLELLEEILTKEIGYLKRQNQKFDITESEVLAFIENLENLIDNSKQGRVESLEQNVFVLNLIKVAITGTNKKYEVELTADFVDRAKYFEYLEKIKNSVELLTGI